MESGLEGPTLSTSRRTAVRRRRSAWFWAVGLVLTTSLAYAIVAAAAVPLSSRPAGVTPGQTEAGKETPLIFVPEPVSDLPPGQPRKELKEQSSLGLTGMGGNGQVKVRLFADAKATDPSRAAEIWALLEDGVTTYDLGVVGNYGLRGVTVLRKDMNGDGRAELVVTGGMGASYGERKIIGYDQGEKRWRILLTMGTPWDGDLDGDGGEDVVAVSGGMIPGYVWIYRWNQDHFEKADVAKSTGNTYAYMNRTADGKVWIEAGQADAARYYQYRGGKLIEISKPAGSKPQ